jgi:hypothetical protein
MTLHPLEAMPTPTPFRQARELAERVGFPEENARGGREQVGIILSVGYDGRKRS